MSRRPTKPTRQLGAKLPKPDLPGELDARGSFTKGFRTADDPCPRCTTGTIILIGDTERSAMHDYGDGDITAGEDEHIAQLGGVCTSCMSELAGEIIRAMADRQDDSDRRAWW